MSSKQIFYGIGLAAAGAASAYYGPQFLLQNAPSILTTLPDLPALVGLSFGAIGISNVTRSLRQTPLFQTITAGLLAVGSSLLLKTFDAQFISARAQRRTQQALLDGDLEAFANPRNNALQIFKGLIPIIGSFGMTAAAFFLASGPFQGGRRQETSNRERKHSRKDLRRIGDGAREVANRSTGVGPHQLGDPLVRDFPGELALGRRPGDGDGLDYRPASPESHLDRDGCGSDSESDFSDRGSAAGYGSGYESDSSSRRSAAGHGSGSGSVFSDGTSHNGGSDSEGEEEDLSRPTTPLPGQAAVQGSSEHLGSQFTARGTRRSMRLAAAQNAAGQGIGE